MGRIYGVTPILHVIDGVAGVQTWEAGDGLLYVFVSPRTHHEMLRKARLRARKSRHEVVVMPFALAGCAFATQAPPAEGYGDLGVSLHPTGAMVSIFTWTERGRVEAAGWVPRERFAELTAVLGRGVAAGDILSRMQGRSGETEVADAD